MREKFSDRKWYPYAVGGSIALAVGAFVFVVLTHLTSIFGAIGTFLGFFSSVFLGCVIAYLMNPLARFLQRTLLKGIKKESLSWILSVTLAIIVVLAFLVLLMGILIPQLVDSATMLVNNLDSYLASLQKFTDSLGISKMLGLENIVDASGRIVNTLVTWISGNANNILGVTASAGRGILGVGIACILSVYLLLGKKSLKSAFSRLGRAVFKEKTYGNIATFLERCDKILVQYIIFSLLDSILVGLINAAFMACLGMQYIGLVSLMVAVTNLIPNFGVFIGDVIGGAILLLVNPLHALLFILFSFALQLLDGYIIRPKLFGNSLGVSGLLILIAVIVGGNMFGIVGMLLAIPAAAIIDFVYEEMLLPALEKRRAESK